MTKERKLAIQMWEYIKDKIDDFDPSIYYKDEDLGFGKFQCYILSLKHEFLKSYDIKWENDCWFCSYCACVSWKNNCPLSMNGECGIYSELICSETREERINYCNMIIEILKGNLKLRSIKK